MKLEDLKITGSVCSRVALEESNVTTLIRSETVKVLKSSLMTFLDGTKVESFACPISRSTTKSLTTDTAVIYLHKVVVPYQGVKKSGPLLTQVERIYSQLFQQVEINASHAFNSTRQIISLSL